MTDTYTHAFTYATVWNNANAPLQREISKVVMAMFRVLNQGDESTSDQDMENARALLIELTLLVEEGDTAAALFAEILENPEAAVHCGQKLILDKSIARLQSHPKEKAAFIEAIEAQWFALMEQRHEALQAALEAAPKSAFHVIVQAHNEDPETEVAFQTLEDYLRKVDPNHSFLAENQLDFDY